VINGTLPETCKGRGGSLWYTNGCLTRGGLFVRRNCCDRQKSPTSTISSYTDLRIQYSFFRGGLTSKICPSVRPAFISFVNRLPPTANRSSPKSYVLFRSVDSITHFFEMARIHPSPIALFVVVIGCDS
jgi:hypothetical protein